MNVKFQENTMQNYHRDNYDREQLIEQYKVLNSASNTDKKDIVVVVAYSDNTASTLDQHTLNSLLELIKFNNNKGSKKTIKSEYSKGKSFVHCFKNNKKYKLNPKEIHYAYCNASGTHLVTQEGEYHTSLTLKKVSELSQLMYCNRSYLVNYAHIRKIEQLENGCGRAYTIHHENAIPVSRQRMKNM